MSQHDRAVGCLFSARAELQPHPVAASPPYSSISVTLRDSLRAGKSFQEIPPHTDHPDLAVGIGASPALPHRTCPICIPRPRVPPEISRLAAFSWPQSRMPRAPLSIVPAETTPSLRNSRSPRTDPPVRSLRARPFPILFVRRVF